MMSGFDSRLFQRTGAVLYVRTGNFLDSLVEAGELYAVSPILAVTNGAPSYITVTTGADEMAHAYVGFVTTQTTVINIYTGSTISVPGTIYPIAGFNFTKPVSTAFTVRTNPTVTNVGTKAVDFLIPGGGGGNAVGGALQTAAQVILPPSTTFLFEAIPEANGKLEISLLFYEERIGSF